jgi:hypothetical protein
MCVQTLGMRTIPAPSLGGILDEGSYAGEQLITNNTVNE